MVNKDTVCATRGATLILPTYLHRLVLLHPAPPVAYPTPGHVESIAGHPARQITRRCDGEAIGGRRSRHQTDRGPYRLRHDAQLTSLLALDARILTGQTCIYPLSHDIEPS